MNLPKCVQKVISFAATLGATVDYSPIESVDIIVDSPGGYVWAATSCTTLCWPFDNGSQTWLAEACKDAIYDMTFGLEKVTDPEELKRIRHDLGEPDWGK